MACSNGGGLRIVSLNVRGFRNKRKRKALFHSFRRDKYDIICLQDTHLTIADKLLVENEWGMNFHFSKGTTKRNGLLTLLNKKTMSNTDEVLLASERILISSIYVNDVQFFIINIYGPCILTEKIHFLETLKNEINSIYNKFTNDNVIICGDFNIVMDNNLDIISGNPHHLHVVKHFRDTMSNLQLND